MAGVQYSTFFLARAWTEQNIQVMIQLPKAGDFSRLCEQHNIPYSIKKIPELRKTSIQISPSRRVPNLFGWLVNFILFVPSVITEAVELKKRKPDIVITKGMSAHFFGGFACRAAGIPCVWHIQDFISERFGGLYKLFFSHCSLMIPDALVADGSPILDQYSEKGHRKAHVVLNGIDTALYKPVPNHNAVRIQLVLPADGFFVGNVARMTPWKGQHILLEAFAKLKTMDKNIYLLLVGSALLGYGSYMDDLKHRSVILGLDDRVIFFGYSKEVEKPLQSMDIFIQCSTEKDTSPLSLLSALSTGLPVVGFDIPGNRDVIEDGYNGIICRRSEDALLAETIDNLIRDHAERKRLAENARASAVANFSVETHAARMMDVVEKVLSNRVREEI